MADHQNDRDMRDAARRLVNRVEASVAGNTTGKPVALLIGEIHDQPSHVIFQQLVMREAQARGLSFTVSMEKPHNTLSDYVKDSLRLKVPDKLTNDPSSCDPAGDMALLASLASDMPDHVPHTHRNKWAYCLHYRLKTVFVDAAHDGTHVDMSDVMTAKYAQALGIDTQKKHHALSPDMMLLRNTMMVDFSLAHAGQAKENLIFMLSGVYHVAGSKAASFLYPGASYETSLHALMTRKGVTSIPVLPRLKRFKTGLVAEDICWFDTPPLFTRTSKEKEELEALFDANGRDLRVHDTDNIKEFVAFSDEAKTKIRAFVNSLPFGPA